MSTSRHHTRKSNKRARINRKDIPLDLEARVNRCGGRSGYALSSTAEDDALIFTTPAVGARMPAASTPFSFSSTKVSGRGRRCRRGAAGPVSLGGITPATIRRNCKERGKRSSSMHIVCAISENLARETCVASMDASAPVELCVTKQANGQTYAETIAYLELLQPHEVLLNEGRQNSKLAQKVTNLFSRKVGDIGVDRNNHAMDDLSYATPGKSLSKDLDNGTGGECMSSTVIKLLPRIYFDQTRGADLLLKVSREGTYDASVVEEYIILASSYAVLHYTQHCLGASFAKGTLLLNINSGGRGRMTIDRSSLLNLELLANARTGKQRDSLLGTIDYTKTNVGSRLLRTNLMAPPTNFSTINGRLELVTALVEKEDLFYNILEHLESLPEFDKMLSFLAMSPRGISTVTVTPRIASKGISALVCIKSILAAIPSFAQVLVDYLSCNNCENIDNLSPSRDSPYMKDKDAESQNCSLNDQETAINENSTDQLLRTILITMQQPCLAHILECVQAIFTESTAFSRNAHAMRHQECFALKPSTDGMLDVVRKAFLANVDDIYRLADSYAEKHNITVAVKETAARGYYLSIPASFAHNLPKIFIQPVKSGRFVHCTTEEVHSLNARAQENVQDMLLMTHERVQEVMELTREYYDALASLSDAIALLDMLHGFADNVVSSKERWCRPHITEEDDALAIRGGRLAIDANSCGLNTRPFIPNDTYAAPFQNFVVITGINGSGKSTYLKQVAIIVVLAQCGSYVPAEEAFIPIRDRLCTRIGTYDDQEHNISTFMLEMKESAFICNRCTDRSLVIIDELGRATSNEDGVAIAWAISEFLLVKRAITLFVTHYPQITRLSDVYMNVQNQHLRSVADQSSGSEVTYTHKVMPGPCKESADYGVEMTTSCGWPVDVIKEARDLRLEVNEKLPDEILCKGPNVDLLGARVTAHKVVDDLAKHLVLLKQSIGKLSESAQRSYLEDIRCKFIPEDPNVLKMIDHLLSLDEIHFESNTDHPTSPCKPVYSTGCRSSTRNITESLGTVQGKVVESTPKNDHEKEQGKIYYSQATKNEDSDALRIELIEEVRHNPSTTRRHLNEKRNDERVELFQNARNDTAKGQMETLRMTTDEVIFTKGENNITAKDKEADCSGDSDFIEGQNHHKSSQRCCDNEKVEPCPFTEIDENNISRKANQSSKETTDCFSSEPSLQSSRRFKKSQTRNTERLDANDYDHDNLQLTQKISKSGTLETRIAYVKELMKSAESSESSIDSSDNSDDSSISSSDSSTCVIKIVSRAIDNTMRKKSTNE